MIGRTVIPAKSMYGSPLLILALVLGLAGCKSKPEREAQSGVGEACRSRQMPNLQSGRRAPDASMERDVSSRQTTTSWASAFREAQSSIAKTGFCTCTEFAHRSTRCLAYIGPMMVTGSVERRGKGAVYKRASVRGAEVNPTKVDVSILEVGSNTTRISIMELPPPAPREHVPSVDRTKAAAQESFRMLD